MSVESEPFLRNSSKKINQINTEAKDQALDLIKEVVFRLKEIRAGISNRGESSGAEIKSYIKPEIGSSNPSITNLISIKEVLKTIPTNISDKLALESQISKTMKNSINGRVRDDSATSKLIKQKRSRLNVRLLKNRSSIATNKLTHQECYSESENYVYAQEQINFSGTEIKREVSISHKAGEILVKQTTLREDDSPKVRTWLYNPSQLLGSDDSLHEAKVALKIAGAILDRCLGTLEVHGVQGSRRQKAGLKLNIQRAKRQELINSAKAHL